jgi:hypothetical protein
MARRKNGEMPDEPSYENYAVEGSVTLMMGDGKTEVATKRFKTRWQRWDVEKEFTRLVQPLMNNGRRFFFKVSHVEPVDAEIVSRLKRTYHHRGEDGRFYLKK